MSDFVKSGVARQNDFNAERGMIGQNRRDIGAVRLITNNNPNWSLELNGQGADLPICEFVSAKGAARQVADVPTSERPSSSRLA